MNTYKPFINYFKRSDSTATIGMSMLVGGVILLWLGWSFYWLFFYFGIALIPIGFGIYLYGSTGRSDENELNKIIKKNTDAISFADIKESKIADALRCIDVTTLTPIEAMNKLFELQNLL